MTDQLSFAVLTVSSSSFKDPSRDQSGPGLVRYLKEKSDSKIQWIHLGSSIVPDDRAQIKENLLKICDEIRPNLLLTTGGTGISPDDVTPEATRDVITKEIPGMSQTMISKSLSITAMAMLSRPVCGIYRETLLINLPGSKNGCVECLDFVYSILLHASDLIRDKRKNIGETHSEMQKTTIQRKVHTCGESSNFQIEKTLPGERIRVSPFPMIKVDEALEIVFQNSETIGFLEKKLEESHGYFCFDEIFAPENFPSFRASIKDGYAVRLFSSENHDQIYEVVGRSEAGGDDINSNLKEGQCVVINTGGKVPDDADAVIQIEDTTVEDRLGLVEKKIRIRTECIKGQDIRQIADDIKIGELLLQKNVRLGPPELGLLATFGLQTVRVFKKASVAVLSTGNELTPIDAPTTTDGKIRDTNKIMLITALKESNISTILDVGTAKDDENSLAQALKSAFQQADVVISTGGVSMGDKDFVKTVLVKHFQATIHFGRLQMKPGKPTTFATCKIDGKTKLFFGLPGNPVSALVTYWLLVVPCLKRMMGNPQAEHPKIRIELNQPIKYLDPRPEYIRVMIDWSTKRSIPIGRIISPENQCSSRLLSAKRCTGLALLPGRNEVNDSFFQLTEDQRGQQVDCLLLSL